MSAPPPKVALSLPSGWPTSVSARAFRCTKTKADAPGPHAGHYCSLRRAASTKKIAALMGMESGRMIDNDLGLLRIYVALGAVQR
jgi:microsomal dipeptidase-like Zn-dependent dipeptidase